MAGRIEIRVRQKLTEGYYTDGVLDTSDDTTINTILQIADIREPEKRATDYIQTFELPATKRNNQTFQHIAEQGFESYAFDPNKKMDAQVYVDGNVYFTGYLQVNAINKRRGVPVSYEVTIYSKLGSFFSDISDLDVSDIVDMSEFDHPLTNRIVAQSWGPINASDPLSAPYPYPSFASEIIRYGLFRPGIYVNRQLRGFTLGYGYVYPMHWAGQADTTNWKTSDFKPAFYVKTIFDKILKSQGITYTSEFLESEYFRRLIIPSYSKLDAGNTSVQLTQEQIAQRGAFVRFVNPPLATLVAKFPTSTGKSYGPYTIKFPNDTTSPSVDVNNLYNPATGVFTIKNGGKYNLTSNIILRLDITNKRWNAFTLDSSYKIHGGRNIPYRVDIRKGASGTVVASYTGEFLIPEDKYRTSVAGDITLYAEASPNLKGVYMAVGETYYFTVSFSTTTSDWDYKTYDGFDNSFYSEKNMEWRVYISSVEQSGAYNPKRGSHATLALADTTVTDGDELHMNDFLPDMKAIEFIKQINTMFCLYWQARPDGSFLIEPRDKFYTSRAQQVIADWTPRLDNDAELKIEPLYDLSAKYWNFTYDTDDTHENKDYTDEYGKSYGDKNFEVDSDFIEDENDIALKFAASPLVNVRDEGKFMTSFTKIEKDIRVYQKPKMRILFYGGLIPTSTWYIKNIYAANPGTGLSMTHYPYAGHIDSPTTPRWDLNWGLAKRYYFSWTSLTTNTLFNMFWASHIDEITDKNSHLLTCDVILTIEDMRKLDIRDTIQMNNVHYRINKITHNPFTGRAKVELFRAKNTQTFLPVGVVSDSSPSTGDGTIPGNNPPPVPTPKPTPIPTPWPTPKPDWPDPWNGGWIDGGVRPWEESGIGDDRPWRRNTTPVTYTIWSGTTTNTVVRTRWSDTPWADITPRNNWEANNVIDANENIFSNQTSASVSGRGNYVAPTATGVRIQGDRNVIGANARSISVVGDNNVVVAGVENVQVFGSNQVVQESNISIINGVVTKEGQVRPTPKVYRGGANAVLNHAPKKRGGINSVDADGIFIGGQDSSGVNKMPVPRGVGKFE